MQPVEEDYPRTLAELESRFSSEQACRDYLVRLRWPEGFQCSRCGENKAWPLRSGRWQCAGCGRQMSVTAETIFQDTRTPLTVWFRAMWWLTSQKNGVSALGLQRVLGLRSYQTAWTLLHKLRRAMVRPGRDRLVGCVEVDETYLGGLEEGVRGRQTESKALIVVAAQEDGKGIGRIRMYRIPDASAKSLIAFVQESVEPGNVIHTDGWLGYDPLTANGYIHKVTYLRGNKKSPSELLPRVHRVVSLLKRWLLGTHQGAVSPKHLDYYLDEFTFRFNRRNSRSRGKLFFRLVQQAVAVQPTTYRSIIDSANADRSCGVRRIGPASTEAIRPGQSEAFHTKSGDRTPKTQ
jgi:transposase-like protein/ribosomal protein L37AE/L43A